MTDYSELWITSSCWAESEPWARNGLGGGGGGIRREGNTVWELAGGLGYSLSRLGWEENAPGRCGIDGNPSPKSELNWDRSGKGCSELRSNGYSRGSVFRFFLFLFFLCWLFVFFVLSNCKLIKALDIWNLRENLGTIFYKFSDVLGEIIGSVLNLLVSPVLSTGRVQLIQPYSILVIVSDKLDFNSVLL